MKLQGFNVWRLANQDGVVKRYSRKDFYKICMTTGRSQIHYADRSFTHDGTILFFGNPHIPYSWEALSAQYEGYTCLFSSAFLRLSERTESILQSPLFKLNGTPVLPIDASQRAFLEGVFERMIDEQAAQYVYKDDVIRNYIHLIIHEAMKLEPTANQEQHHNAASRLTSVFLELLERQFPIESMTDRLQLRTAKDFAEALAVHVNYLNRSVKAVTGKTTSEHVIGRVATEAKALLQHTNWSVNEIAFALGFEYPTYFNAFFKKQTHCTPLEYRINKAASKV